ncbi:hypothetical protein PIB30_060929 [Stylosanthes scabra]|uniref:Phytocyanin domain-containing protein n=1 Tax=Stylosanthes scabra TaxID=79078 RepID=A0ABU6TKI0_9FABA|nr:hypothetical protein [Stylosanthes scabra]
MAKSIALVASSFLILLLAFPTVFATDFTVGDSSGWALKVDYTAWAKGKTFQVGDTLTFKYNPSFHQVDEVNKSSHDGCNSSNPIKNYKDGNTKITLSKEGNHYFLCPIGDHCSSGMKLAVTVAASSSGSPSKSPSGSPSTPSTTTPSPAPTVNGAVGVSSGFTQFSGAFVGSALVLGFMF